VDVCELFLPPLRPLDAIVKFTEHHQGKFSGVAPTKRGCRFLSPRK
jgi:hypothetical protein